MLFTKTNDGFRASEGGAVCVVAYAPVMNLFFGEEIGEGLAVCVEDVSVPAELRRRGIGSRLLAAALEKAEEAHPGRPIGASVPVYDYDDEEALRGAVAFFEAHGFALEAGGGPTRAMWRRGLPTGVEYARSLCDYGKDEKGVYYSRSCDEEPWTPMTEEEVLAGRPDVRLLDEAGLLKAVEAGDLANLERTPE